MWWPRCKWPLRRVAVLAAAATAHRLVKPATWAATAMQGTTQQSVTRKSIMRRQVQASRFVSQPFLADMGTGTVSRHACSEASGKLIALGGATCCRLSTVKKHETTQVGGLVG